VTSAARSPLRPTVVAWAVLGAILASFVVVVLTVDGDRSLAGRVGGDFPAFYGAGSIVADGDADDLYDLGRQREAQAGLHPDEQEVQYFAYPPPVAAGYSLLARIPYVPAYVLHTGAMALALVAAFLVVRPMLPALRPPGSVLAAVVVTFLPTFMAVTLGQNSALVVLLLAVSWRAARDENDVLAGLALGALLFKPQYAVPVIGLHLLRLRWRIVATSAAAGAVWWIAGLAMLGAGWVGAWSAQVGEFNAVDAEVNGANAISWLGIAEHWLGVGSSPAILVGGVLALATAGLLARTWWRRPATDLAVPIAVAAAGVLLISPHAMFYDATLLLLAVAGLAAAGRLPDRRMLAAGWLLGALHPLKDVVGITPVAAVVIGAFVAAARAARDAPPARAGAPAIATPDA